MSKALIDFYTKEQLQKIVETSASMAEVATRLGYTTRSGRNSATIKKRLERFGIQTNFYYKTPERKTSKEVFCLDSSASQQTLRRWYYKQENIKHVCAICGQSTIWNNKKLTLILDHINGNKHDNRMENLRLVCPNCNQQLETTMKRKGKRI